MVLFWCCRLNFRTNLWAAVSISLYYYSERSLILQARNMWNPEQDRHRFGFQSPLLIKRTAAAEFANCKEAQFSVAAQRKSSNISDMERQPPMVLSPHQNLSRLSTLSGWTIFFAGHIVCSKKQPCRAALVHALQNNICSKLRTLSRLRSLVHRPKLA
jgi:hypothetical protein